jgi:flagellar M-ring protein FliF
MDFLTSLRTRWDALTATTRVVLGAGLGTFLVVVALAWPTQVPYVTLARDLPLADMQGITEALTKKGVPFRLADNGTRIEVTEADYATARVFLASSPVASGQRPGFELFDGNTWSMTEFASKIAYRRSLEGELARSIRGIEGVQDVDVRLTLPEQGLLLSSAQDAKAAVRVRMHPGQRLTSGSVEGIQELVANSVERLPVMNVAVLDERGRLVSSPDTTGSLGLTAKQLEVQRQLEQTLGERIVSMLDPILGATHVRAEASLLLNWDIVNRTSERYDPDGAVLRTEQRADTPSELAVDSLGERSGTVIANQFDNSRMLEQALLAPGSIRRLSLAVLLDEAVLREDPAERAEQLAAIRTAVQGAAGADPARGDQVSISVISFEEQARADSTSQAEVAAAAAARPEWTWWALAGGIALLVLVTIIYWQRRKAVQQPTEVITPEPVAEESPAETEETPVELTQEEVARALAESVRTDVAKFVADNPGTSLAVINQWLAEGR